VNLQRSTTPMEYFFSWNSHRIAMVESDAKTQGLLLMQMPKLSCNIEFASFVRISGKVA